MFQIKRLVILVPCHNEEQGIGIVLGSIPKDSLHKLGYETGVIVIDNNCIDKTAEIALSKGAKVVKEPKQGKGHAIIRGFREINGNADIVVMIDGDGSYDIKELPRLLEPLESDFGDVIVGSRLHGKLKANSMTSLNRLGNWFFTFLARVGFKTNVTDVCSGFFAWKKNVIENLALHLESSSFSIEMEMIAKLAKMNYSCYSVPISYYPRNGKSSLRPIKDGLFILCSWLKYLTWSPDRISITRKELLYEAESTKGDL